MWPSVIVFITMLLLAISSSAEATRHQHQKTLVRKPKKIIVLITGSSSGVGEATALYLAQDPTFKVWATMRDTSIWDHPEAGSNLHVAQLDVTSEDSVNSTVHRIFAEDGRVDVLINSAGYGIAGTVEMVEVADAQAMFDVNVWGVVRMLQAVLPNMRMRGSGQVINLVGTAGVRGIPCMDIYTGSKFALEGIMDSMRYNVAPYNISITNINAGPVQSQFNARLINEKGRREVKEDDINYASRLTDGLLIGLQARTNGPDGQTSEQIAQHIRTLIDMRFKAKRLTDVPFNIGSTMDSQEILEEVRVNPTGWGGLYNDILQGMPPLRTPKPPSSNEYKDSDPPRHEEL